MTEGAAPRLPKQAVDLADVEDILGLFHRRGIRVIVEGGWAIDALVGRQSRQHADLDIAVDAADLTHCHAVLEEHGFSQIADELPIRVVFTDTTGRNVDVHPRDLGSHWYASVTVHRSLGDTRVECLVPKRQIEQHANYEPRAVDLADLSLLEALAAKDLPNP